MSAEEIVALSDKFANAVDFGYLTHPDSLACAIETLDLIIKEITDTRGRVDADFSMCYPALYGNKAQLLCFLGKVDSALVVLEDAEKKYGLLWINQFTKAMICDFKGDSISASLDYERVIDYCSYKLEKKEDDSIDYEKMFFTCLTAKLLRYGMEGAEEDIKCLKAQKDYYEGSPLYYSVLGFENFDKQDYLEGMMGKKTKLSPM